MAKLTFNVHEDAEFRKELKDAVEAELKTTLRQSLNELIQSELEKKLKADSAVFNTTINNAVTKELPKVVSAAVSNTVNSKIIQDSIVAQVGTKLKDIETKFFANIKNYFGAIVDGQK